MVETALVDLHIHTTASDGCWGPEETVAAVKDAGIGLFAVADHETTENVGAVGRLAAQAGIPADRLSVQTERTGVDLFLVAEKV